jgi:SAM-dependent methyltransferase
MTQPQITSADHPRSTKSSKAKLVNISNKNQSQKSCLHSIYIFPKIRNDRNILELSKQIDANRVFFMHTNENSLKGLEIEDEDKEYSFNAKNGPENENLELSESIRNIQTDKAKRWKLNYNGSLCHMLVLHKNCSNASSPLMLLRKELGKIIENEAINHFAIFLDVQIEAENASKSQRDQSSASKDVPRKDKMQNQKQEAENETQKTESKLSTKRKGADQSIGEKSKKPRKNSGSGSGSITFKTQELIAEELYNRIKEKLTENNDIDLKEKFESFEFLILLPNLISLEKQTIDRIKKKFNNNKKQERNVIRICPNSTELHNKWNKFLHKAGTNPKTLFLVIHDECHWAAGSKGTIGFLGFDKGDYHYLDGELLPNLFTLMVSATPYNFFAHLQPKDILYWDEHLKNKKIQNTYQGLSHFRKGTENCKMLSTASDMSEWWEENKDHFAPIIQNGFTKDFILVLLDYCIAISVRAPNKTKQCSFPLNLEVSKCVEKCIDENKQIILRLEGAFDEIRQTEVAKTVLQNIIEVCKKEIEVIVLTSNEQEQENTDTFLEDKPKIFLIVEQFKMGKTFPKACISFDLRARYLAPVKVFSTIIQDVGRAFGYSKRPLLLLSQQANAFLTDIWDSKTGYISWESLKEKKKLRSVLMGQNTIRKPVDKNLTESEAEIEPETDTETDTKSNAETKTEVDSTEMILKQFQEIYDHDPKETVFLFRKIMTGDCDALKHRTFLKADPQNGKTGAFLHLAFLLEEKLCKDSFFLRDFTTKSYTRKNLDEIEQAFKTKKGREEHRKYLRALGRAREKRKEVGIVEPSKWAALCLIQNLFENWQQNPAVIQIADFGCGDMQFANFLYEELQKKPELAAIKICIHAFDISPNEITITSQLENSKQILIQTHPGISCGDKTKFKEKSYDYIVSTLALFGNEDSWKKIIQTAFCALKTNGIFILAEWDKYLSSKTAQKLLPAGIICNHFAPGIFKLWFNIKQTKICKMCKL